MGRPEMAEKHKIRRPKFAAVTAFADPILERPTATGREILPTPASRRPPPPWPARVQGGWP